MTSPSRSISTLEGSILGLLARDGESSGWDLLRSGATSAAYFVPFGRSQVYAALPRLEARGLIETCVVRQDGRPDKSMHTITDDGRTQLAAWVASPTDEAGRETFLAKVFFGVHMSRDDLRERIREKRDGAAVIRDQLTAMHETPDLDDLFHRLTREWGLWHAEATIAWADEALAVLGALDQDPIDQDPIDQREAARSGAER